MIVVTCDLCKNRMASIDGLQRLMEKYRTEKVEEVCFRCLKEINQQLEELRTEHNKIIAMEIQHYITDKEKKVNG